jgi:3-oxoacyl-[acyl-carrier protein] reductase
MDPVPHISRSVSGKVALITGAASGMGRATAHLFARDGASVAVTDLEQASAEIVAAEIRAEGGQAQAWKLDVADAADIEGVVAQVAEQFGGLDIVINNAGTARLTPIDSPGYDSEWDREFAILLTSHQRLIRAALPHLRKSSSPRIINVASTEAFGGTPKNSIYAAAKTGVVGLTRGLAVELGPEGITVNCVCPGPILTGMTEKIPDADRATFARRRTALRRYGLPVEVAHITLSLCTPAAAYITGAVIPVDGGLSARNA